MMSSDNSDSEGFTFWPDRTPNDAESVPLVVLDDPGSEQDWPHNYDTRIIEPQETVIQTHPRNDIKRWIYCSKFILWFFTLAISFTLGLVVWTYHQVASVLPHTFSWEALLVIYGFLYKVKHGDSYYSETWLIVPIVHLSFLCGILLLSCSFLFFKSCREYSLYMMKIFCFAQMIFLLLGLPIILILWYEVSTELHTNMMVGLNSNSNGSIILWNITQTMLQCCGVDNFQDWHTNNITNILPSSCYIKTKNLCNWYIQSNCTWWTNGCYEYEIQTLNYYGGFEIIWIVLGFIFSIGSFFSTKIYVKYSMKLEELDIPLKQQIFMKMGDNFLSINNEGRGKTMIQLKDINLITKGALSSSTGVINNGITMDVHNYCIFDKINICREYDRIIINVCTNDIIRGTGLITTKSQNTLKKIRVVHNNGIIRISTPF